MSEPWRIEPRDPLVFGNGQTTAGSVGREVALPPPGTLAGMVRTACARGPVDALRAQQLLEIGVRSGWLLCNNETWVAAPADGAFERSRCGGGTFHRGRLLRPAAHDGLCWPADGGLERTLSVDAGASKVEPIDKWSPVWPLSSAVAWALGGRVTPPPVGALSRETRTHVALDDETGTAADAQLFTSSGTRFHRDFSLGLEVDLPAREQPATNLPGVVYLGGEARASFRRDDQKAAFPPFDAFRSHYEQDKSVVSRARGLRLQLLTHGAIDLDDGQLELAGAPAWRPSWIDTQGMATGGPLRQDLTLRLVAVCTPGFVALSGWDMQGVAGRNEGAPRVVRRLVPAGSVYFFEWHGPHDPMAECKHLWGAFLEPRTAPRQSERNAHRAPPALDGYGLLLPGLWSDSDCVQ